MDLIFTDTYTIRPFETGTGDRLTLPGFLDLFQDLAGRHATHLGFGMETLLASGTAWVLNKTAVEVGTLPKVGEALRIETWPSGLEGLYAWRDVRAYDAEGREVARGTTRWLTLDVIRRRPLRAPASLGRYVPDERPASFPLFEAPPASGARVAHRPVLVRYADLDVNRHVNNVRYAEWMVEAFDLDFLDTHTTTRLAMTLKAETQRGDALVTEVQRAEGVPDGYVHRIVRDSDGREVATGFSVWRRRVPEAA